jgi:MYXO-CTERM domain-containing protein
MLRIVLVCAVLMAPALAAQDSEPLSGSVPSQRRLSYLYSIDFGPATVNYSLACNLMTPSAAGLIVRLIDVDLLAGSGALVPPGVDEHVLSGVGTANVALSGMYSGVHDFMVEVESPGAGSTFTGSLTGSMGAIDFISSDQLVLTATGFRATVGRRGVWDGNFFGSQLVASSFELDLGPVSRTIFFRFAAVGSNIDEIQLIDTSGSASVVLTTFNSGLPDATAVPLTGSGIKTLRVNVRGQPGVSASAKWTATAPSGVDLRAVSIIEDEGDDDDDGCAAGAAGALPWGLLALMAGPVLRRRYRHA